MDHELRRRGLGGTDMAAVMGKSPWRDPVDVWMEKVGHPMWAPKPETPAMRWGKILEPVVRDEYSRDTRLMVIPANRATWADPEVAIFADDGVRFAHPDGLVGDEGIWEGKTSSQPEEWETGVPLYYQIQVQHYLDITRRRWADVSVLLPGGDFRTYRLDADAGLQLDIMEAADRFWTDHVHGRVPPGPVPHQIKVPVADKDKTIEANDEQILLVAEWIALAGSGKDGEARIEAIKEQVKQYMDDAGHMTLPGGYRVDYTHSKAPVTVGWEQVATSLWNTLEVLRRLMPDREGEIAQHLDPGLYDLLVGMYSITGKATRPLVARKLKESKA